MAYEIDFLRAGDSNGDAIVVRWAEARGHNYYINVIDGGFTDTGEQLIGHIERHYKKDPIIHNVVLSHADNDHACGLIKVVERLNVQNLWMNKPWDYVDETIQHFHGLFSRDGLIKKMRDMHPYLVEMEKIAARRGIPIHAPLQGASIGAFRVLAPSRQRYVRLIPDLEKTPPSYVEKAGLGGVLADAFRGVLEKAKEALDIETLDKNPPATSASNETSVVQMGIFGDQRVLLTGDVGPEGLQEAADHAENILMNFRPNLVQVPHHGSRRNVTPAVLNRWLGGYPAQGTRGNAIASVGQDKGSEYPRKKVSNAFIRRGYRVYSTKDGWVNFRHDWDERPNMTALDPLPFSPEVED